MPQTPDRKKQYAKERLSQKGDAIRSKQAEWRAANAEYLREKSTKRRMEKRAMCLVAAARVRARRKGVEFSLTADDIEQLQATISRGVCELSGVALTLLGRRSATSPSLDRIQSQHGYVSGNVRIVCHALNAGLGDWGEDALFAIASAWVARQRSSEP